jgi:hypothetical protein
MKKNIEKKNRDIRCSFRMTKEEAEILAAAAAKLGAKPSDIARLGILSVGAATSGA